MPTPKEHIERSSQFVQEVWVELKKVHWPTMDETRPATVVVVVTVFVIAAYLGTVDFLLSQVVNQIITPGR